MNGTELDNLDMPVELREIAAAMDTLAAHERGAARHGLEGRVFERTRGALDGRAERSQKFRWFASARFITRMRVAAAVAICGTAGAGWLSQMGHSAKQGLSVARASTLEDDVDMMLALRNLGMGSMGERIDVLFSDTAAVRDSVKNIGDQSQEGDSL